MRLYVPLDRSTYEALERLAAAERRRPQDQAAVLLSQPPLTPPSPRVATAPTLVIEPTTPCPPAEDERVPA